MVKALFLLGVATVGAFRAKQRSESCLSPNLVLGPVKGIVNVMLKNSLPNPVDLDLYNINQTMSLGFCDTGLNMDTTLALAGMQGRVSELGCVSSKCIEDGLLGMCKRTEYTLSAAITLGDTINAAGSNDALWNLCGKEILREVSVSFDMVKPLAQAELVVIHGLRTGIEIVGVSNVGVDWETPTNFKCGLPGFLGSLLEVWCENIIGWIVVGLEDPIKSLLNKVFEGIIGQLINTPDAAMP